MRSISVIFITGILSIYVYSICTFESEFLLQISNKMISAISAHLRLATKRFLELIRNKRHVLIEVSLRLLFWKPWQQRVLLRQWLHQIVS